MPSYTLDGFLVGRRGPTPATLQIDTGKGDAPVRFDVAGDFFEGLYLQLAPGSVRGLSIDGTALPEDTQITYEAFGWGAGLMTEVLGVSPPTGKGFAAFVAGDALPAQMITDEILAAEVSLSIVLNSLLLGEAIPRAVEPDTDIAPRDLFTSNLKGAEVEGDAGRNTLKGTGKAEVLTGLAGDDVLKGRGGDDTLFTGLGRDVALGGGGSDLLSGFLGSDRLNGQGGSDVLLGGRGDDVLTGGRGGDLFVFERGDGKDVVRDFFKGNDTLLLDPFLWRKNPDIDTVVARYGEDRGDDFVLDFGKRGEITLEGAAGRAEDVADAIDVLFFF